jgi:putative hydrolase of the HAD superfamily
MPTEADSRIKAVILDYGEVLCHGPAPHFIQSMADVFKLSPQAFRAIYDRHRLPYDRGDYSPEVYWSKFEEETKSKLTPAQLQQLRDWDVAMWSEIDPAMLAWVDSLRSHNLNLALLSNMHADMARGFRERFAWISKFDAAVLSAEIRAVKPEPTIYLRTLAALGVSPAEALFIDDRERNIRGAHQVGIKAIRFESISQLARELENPGLKDIPSPLAEGNPV